MTNLRMPAAIPFCQTDALQTRPRSLTQPAFQHHFRQRSPPTGKRLDAQAREDLGAGKLGEQPSGQPQLGAPDTGTDHH